MYNVKTDKKLNRLGELFRPYKLYAVGGFVRNSLMGLPPSDTDICSELTVDIVKEKIAGGGFIVAAEYNKLGTLKLKDDEGGSYEYTTFRREIYGEGGRHTPSGVEFCKSLLSDAKRRDFTVNAIYYNIQEKKTEDPLNGIADLNNKIIRAADNPFKVFSSDGLRLLRAVRFACELCFEIESETYNAAKENSSLLKDIKSERIYEELHKILTSDLKYPGLSAGKFPHYRGTELLKELNLLPLIIPGIEYSYGVMQREDFHKYDVFEHTAQTVKFSETDIRLPALLHDIGKGLRFKEQGNFYGHENAGAEKAAQILGQNGLKCPKRLIDETVFLIKNHMYDLNCKTGENKVKNFIVKNFPYIEKLLMLKQADYLGCGLKDGISPTVSRWRELIETMKKDNVPFSLKGLNLGGQELLDSGCPPHLISKILNELHTECVYNPKLNKKEKLMYIAEKLINKYKYGGVKN